MWPQRTLRPYHVPRAAGGTGVDSRAPPRDSTTHASGHNTLTGLGRGTTVPISTQSCRPRITSAQHACLRGAPEARRWGGAGGPPEREARPSGPPCHRRGAHDDAPRLSSIGAAGSTRGTAHAATAAPSVDDRAEGGSVEQRHDPAPGCARAPNIAAGRLRGSCSCGSSLRLLRSEPSAGDVAQAVEVHTVVAHRDQRAVAAAGSARSDLCAKTAPAIHNIRVRRPTCRL